MATGRGSPTNFIELIQSLTLPEPYYQRIAQTFGINQTQKPGRNMPEIMNDSTVEARKNLPVDLPIIIAMSKGGTVSTLYQEFFKDMISEQLDLQDKAPVFSPHQPIYPIIIEENTHTAIGSEQHVVDQIARELNKIIV